MLELTSTRQINRQQPLVLASQSPRRQTLLERLEVPFRKLTVDFHEPPFSGGRPLLYGLEIVRGKYQQSRGAVDPGEWILAGDTIVVIDGDILGKPPNMDSAHRMLAMLENRTHYVVSCLLLGDGRNTCWTWAPAISAVTMGRFPPSELDRYLHTDEPYDKAGAYAIQGWAGRHIRKISGSHSNVMGLPTFLLPYLFRRCGLRWRFKAPDDPPIIRRNSKLMV